MMNSSIRRGRAPAMTALVFLAATTSGLAQPAEPGGPRSPQALTEGVDVQLIQPGSPGTGPRVDESALRYFAEKGDRAAVQAEIGRLKSLDPSWEPPGDLFVKGPRVDERPLWALYEARDFPALREAIKALTARYPGWSPPVRLLQLVENQEVRGELERLEQSKDWQGIVTRAGQHPSQLGCADVDNLWRLAEAQQRLGDEAAALASYRKIVTSCEPGTLGVASVQKAKLLLAPAKVQELVTLLEGRAPEAAAAAKLRESIAPPRPAAPPQSPLLTALYARKAGLPAAEAAADLVLRTRNAAGARKIGWVNHEAKRFDEAAAWFRRSLDWRTSKEAAEGLALSLAELGRFEELDALVAQMPTVAGPIADRLKGGRLNRELNDGDYAAVLRSTKGSHAHDELVTRGWALMKLDRPAEALQSFSAALAAANGPTPQQEECYYGMARAYLAMGTASDAAAVGERIVMNAAWRQEVRIEVMGASALAAFNAKDYRQATRLLAMRRSMGEPDRNFDMLEGWSRYHLGQYGEAERIFADVNRLYSTAESRDALKVVRARNSLGIDG